MTESSSLERRHEDIALSHKLDRNWRWLILVMTVLLLGGIAEYVSVQRQNDRLAAAAIKQCQRVQGLRDLVNYDNELMTRAQLVVGTVLAQRSLVKVLSPPDAATRVRDTVRIAKISDLMLTEAPTNCAAAVDSPEHYKPPPPTSIAGRTSAAPRP